MSLTLSVIFYFKVSVEHLIVTESCGTQANKAKLATFSAAFPIFSPMIIPVLPPETAPPIVPAGPTELPKIPPVAPPINPPAMIPIYLPFFLTYLTTLIIAFCICGFMTCGIDGLIEGRRAGFVSGFNGFLASILSVRSLVGVRS
jgi:hypothetical protein